ncbi:hypothetical protein, partial [Klebsiella pneumoniae]
PRLETDEVENKAVERNLSLELQAVELAVAQSLQSMVASARIERAKPRCDGLTGWRIADKSPLLRFLALRLCRPAGVLAKMLKSLSPPQGGR